MTLSEWRARRRRREFFLSLAAYSAVGLVVAWFVVYALPVVLILGNDYWMEQAVSCWGRVR